MNVQLPFPHKVLWPNGRGHHMAKHREFQKHKAWAYGATLADPTRPLTRRDLRLSFTIYPKTRHAIDRDNAVAAMKAYIDGIAQAIRIDDQHFATPEIHFAEPVKGGMVVVTIGGGE